MLFDRDKIEKVFYNLLSNAFKFTPDGGRIALRIETMEQEGQYYVRITVRDTGCGIRSEEQTRIFERFYQTGNIPHEQGRRVRHRTYADQGLRKPARRRNRSGERSGGPEAVSR